MWRLADDTSLNVALTPQNATSIPTLPATIGRDTRGGKVKATAKFMAIGALLSGAGTLIIVGNAHGLTVGGFGGTPWKPSDASCFSVSSFSGAVSNTCSSDKSWLVPLQTPDNATATFTFRASANEPFGTLDIVAAPICRYVVADRYGTSVHLGASTVINNNTSLGSESVSSTETAHIDCRLAGTNEIGGSRGLGSVRFY